MSYAVILFYVFKTDSHVMKRFCTRTSFRSV